MSSKEIDETASGDLVERAQADRAAKKSWFGRIVLFIQQVLAELKKVVTPTRKELVPSPLVAVSYTHLDVYKRQGLTHGDGSVRQRDGVTRTRRRHRAAVGLVAPDAPARPLRPRRLTARSPRPGPG